MLYLQGNSRPPFGALAINTCCVSGTQCVGVGRIVLHIGKSITASMDGQYSPRAQCIYKHGIVAMVFWTYSRKIGEFFVLLLGWLGLVGRV